jgi:hypothetical protein
LRGPVRAALGLALGLALALALAAAPAAPRGATEEPWEPLELPAPLARLLATGRWDATPGGFRVVALSFLADGCAAAADRDAALRPAARACVDRALQLADRLRPRARDDATGDRTDHGLWLSHLALVLGARDRLGPCPDPARHRAIAEALAARTLREPTHHVPSYPGTRLRWPADQTATLAALARYDRAHGAHLSDAPVAVWRGWILAQAMDRRLGLPWSEGHRARPRRPPPARLRPVMADALPPRVRPRARGPVVGRVPRALPRGPGGHRWVP